MSIGKLIKDVRRLSPKIGYSAALFNITARSTRSLFSKHGCAPSGAPMRHYIKWCKYPVSVRYGTSDIKVFEQVFVDREYECLDDIGNPRYIVDCGAHAGYSSVYFLNRFPGARIDVIEPDKANFNICLKNLLPYKSRVSLRHAAVWPCKAKLVVCRGQDGWATRVRECHEGEKHDIGSVDINTLMKDSGFGTIDLLKVDIEGAEKYLFAEKYDTWIGKVRNIVIELHDEDCRRVFFKALAAFDYRVSQRGDLTVCKAISPKTDYCENIARGR